MFSYVSIGLISSALLMVVSANGPCVCNRNYWPVCARSEDGSRRTYNNFCLAECNGHTRSTVEDGECPVPCACPFIWNPVCGSNGVIFGNECALRCSGFQQADFSQCPQISQLPAGVKRDHKRGVCVCPSIYARVCDQAGNEYANTCIATQCFGESNAKEEYCPKFEDK